MMASGFCYFLPIFLDKVNVHDVKAEIWPSICGKAALCFLEERHW
jgi:hypothetical protein